MSIAAVMKNIQYPIIKIPLKRIHVTIRKMADRAFRFALRDAIVFMDIARMLGMSLIVIL